MYQAFRSVLQGHEGAEIDDACHLDLHHSARFEFAGQVFDPFLSCIDGFRVRSRDLDGSVVGDVDLGSGFFDDPANHLATRTDDRTDLLGGNLDSGEFGCVR